jgi:hypothetical protein
MEVTHKNLNSLDQNNKNLTKKKTPQFLFLPNLPFFLPLTMFMICDSHDSLTLKPLLFSLISLSLFVFEGML